MTDDPDLPSDAPDGETDERRPRGRRGHRRAVGGTARADAPEPRAPKDDADTEAGWGARPEEDDDDRILREKPPHW